MTMGTVFALLALNLAGFLVVWLLLRREVRRSASPAAQLEEMRAEVDRMLVDLNQTTERNILLLEDRIAGLTDLLSQADKKMDLLRREAEKREMGARVYAKLGEGRLRTVEERHPLPAERAAPAVEAPAAAAPRQEPPRPEAAPGFPEPRQDEVIRLYRAGFSSALIAGKTGIPRGEVELIISLEEGKGRT